MRLIAFNLDQRTIIFREDGFDPNKTDNLTAALNRLVLGCVDYRILQESAIPMNFLLGIVEAEFKDPKQPDALIVMGPRTRLQNDVRRVRCVSMQFCRFSCCDTNLIGLS